VTLPIAVTVWSGSSIGADMNLRHSLGSNTITAEKVGVLEVDLAVRVRELEPLKWMMEREELV